MIKVADYPALKMLLWYYHAPEIKEEHAFYYYERDLAKWFDKHEISEAEMKLINELSARYGNGVSLF